MTSDEYIQHLDQVVSHLKEENKELKDEAEKYKKLAMHWQGKYYGLIGGKQAHAGNS